MQLNKPLLLLVSLIQGYRNYTIDLGILQESFAENKTDWYKETRNYYYGLDKKYFEAAGVVQNEWCFLWLLSYTITEETDRAPYSEISRFHFPDEAADKENSVSSFFFYMWNAWCEEECKVVYGWEYAHFWNKWCHSAKDTPQGAAEKFYAELTTGNRQKLVKRSSELYDGSKKRQ